jgi:hypothetical protein
LDFRGAAPVVHHSKSGGQCLRWVKLGRTQSEQMSSGLACALSSTRICAAKSTRRRGEAKPIFLGPSKKLSEKHRAYVVRKRRERACHLMMTTSATLSEIALSVSVFPIKHIFACASGRRLVKVHPDGDETLSADKDYPIGTEQVHQGDIGLLWVKLRRTEPATARHVHPSKRTPRPPAVVSGMGHNRPSGAQLSDEFPAQ